MHWNPALNRPDLTYFNLGAIGAYFGHLDVLSKARAQGIKYALVMEDNVVPTPRLYEEVETLREKGDSFEAIFFHCIARLTDGFDGSLERVKWISSMKCYLVHVPNMFPYYKKYMRVMNNHVDTKMEDVAAAGARIFFKDMGHYARRSTGVSPVKSDTASTIRWTFLKAIHRRRPKRSNVRYVVMMILFSHATITDNESSTRQAARC